MSNQDETLVNISFVSDLVRPRRSLYTNEFVSTHTYLYMMKKYTFTKLKVKENTQIQKIDCYRVIVANYKTFSSSISLQR